MLRAVLFSIIISTFSIQAKTTLTFSAPQYIDLHNISILVLRKAYEKLGYNIKIVELPNARALDYANSGRYDGELSRIGGASKLYPNLIQIPVSINKLELAAYSDKPIPDKFTNDKSDSLLFIAERGMILAKQYINKYNLDYVEVVSYDQGIELIKSGRADIGLFPFKADTGKLKIGTSRYKVGFKKILETERLYHYIHKKNEHLAEELTKALQEMEDNGEIEFIYNNWLTENLH